MMAYLLGSMALCAVASANPLLLLEAALRYLQMPQRRWNDLEAEKWGREGKKKKEKKKEKNKENPNDRTQKPAEKLFTCLRHLPVRCTQTGSHDRPVF